MIDPSDVVGPYARSKIRESSGPAGTTVMLTGTGFCPCGRTTVPIELNGHPPTRGSRSRPRVVPIPHGCIGRQPFREDPCHPAAHTSPRIEPGLDFPHGRPGRVALRLRLERRSVTTTSAPPTPSTGGSGTTTSRVSTATTSRAGTLSTTSTDDHRGLPCARIIGQEGLPLGTKTGIVAAAPTNASWTRLCGRLKKADRLPRSAQWRERQLPAADESCHRRSAHRASGGRQSGPASIAT